MIGNLVGGIITGGLGLPSGSGTLVTMNLFDVYIIQNLPPIPPFPVVDAGGGGYVGGFAWNVFPDGNFLVPIEGDAPPFYVPTDKKKWFKNKIIRFKVKFKVNEAEEVLSDYGVPIFMMEDTIRVKKIDEVTTGISVNIDTLVCDEVDKFMGSTITIV